MDHARDTPMFFRKERNASEYFRLRTVRERLRPPGDREEFLSKHTISSINLYYQNIQQSSPQAPPESAAAALRERAPRRMEPET
jgi:hypothetical protein